MCDSNGSVVYWLTPSLYMEEELQTQPGGHKLLLVLVLSWDKSGVKCTALGMDKGQLKVPNSNM